MIGFHNDVDKSSTIALGYGTYQSNKKNNIKENIVKDRLNILLRETIHIQFGNQKKIIILVKIIFIPAVIQKGYI